MDKEQFKTIDYNTLTMESLKNVIYKVLKITEKQGLLEKHHFYITFLTSAPGVKIPDFLKIQYPDEITIVMQHKFWDLKVYKNYFSVTLKFNNKIAELVITFKSIVAFNDPSSNFSLKWEKPDLKVKGNKKLEPLKLKKENKNMKRNIKKVQEKSSDTSSENKIVKLDSYRKDRK